MLTPWKESYDQPRQHIHTETGSRKVVARDSGRRNQQGFIDEQEFPFGKMKVLEMESGDGYTTT